jgi:hypothetical protein
MEEGGEGRYRMEKKVSQRRLEHMLSIQTKGRREEGRYENGEKKS